MKLSQSRAGGRAAFTLIELLMVIAIIGILVGLISAVAFKALGVGKEARARNEITQLANALESFKVKFGRYPPSRIILCETGGGANGYGPDPDGDPTAAPPVPPSFHSAFHRESLEFIRSFWPRIDYAGPDGSIGDDGTPAKADDPLIDWNGNGAPDSSVVLEGDQCLVFFLGGIPTQANGVAGCLGFSTNPKNPAQADPPPPPVRERIRFYDFESGRLIDLLAPTAASNNAPYNAPPTPPDTAPYPVRSVLHFSYQDLYAKPATPNQLVPQGPPTSVYAYLSTWNRTNGYNRHLSATYPYSDCLLLGLKILPGSSQPIPAGTGVWPYAEAPLPNSDFPFMRYHNPNSYQIISPGKNRVFGLGTNSAASIALWRPDNAEVFAPDGADDISNFYENLLGIGK